MSRILNDNEYVEFFDLNERVSFMNPSGERIHGFITRVYASGTFYHVQGDDGERYEVSAIEDAMRKVRTLI